MDRRRDRSCLKQRYGVHRCGQPDPVAEDIRSRVMQEGRQTCQRRVSLGVVTRIG